MQKKFMSVIFLKRNQINLKSNKTKTFKLMFFKSILSFNSMLKTETLLKI